MDGTWMRQRSGQDRVPPGMPKPILRSTMWHFIQTCIFEASIRLTTQNLNQMSKRPLFLRLDGALKKINPDEIIFLETARNYVKFHSLKNTMLVRITLDDALKQLPQDEFVKVHRFFAVSVNYIDEIGADVLTLTGIKDAVPVSKKCYAELIRQINILGLVLPDEEA